MHIGADQTYKFIHLIGVHLPYAFDADGNRKFAASEMDVGLNSLRIVDKYLSKLKEIGAFDNSLILSSEIMEIRRKESCFMIRSTEKL